MRAIQAFYPVSVPMVSPVDGSGYQEWTAGHERALAEELAGWAGKYPDVEVERRVIDEHPVACLLEQSLRATRTPQDLSDRPDDPTDLERFGLIEPPVPLKTCHGRPLLKIPGEIAGAGPMTRKGHENTAEGP